MDNRQNEVGFLEFLFSDFLFLFLILILVFFLVKYFKKTTKKDNQKEDFEAINDEENDEEIVDLLESNNLKDSLEIDADYERKQSQEEYFDSDNIISKRIDTLYDENYYPKENELSTELIEEMSTLVTGGNKSILKYIKRVNKDGKILFPLDALDFITKKHEPLIMPDGTIRCMNILSLDEDIKISFKEGKPLFFLDEETEEIIRLLPEDVERLFIKEELVDNLMSLKKIEESYGKLNKDSVQLLKKYDAILEENTQIIAREKTLIASFEKLVNPSVKEEVEIIQVAKKEQKASEDKNLEIHEKRVTTIGVPQKRRTKEEIEKDKISKEKNKPSSLLDIKEPAAKEETSLVEDKVKETVKIIKEEKTIIADAENKEVEIVSEPVVDSLFPTASENIKKITKQNLPTIKKLLLSEAYLFNPEKLKNSDLSPKDSLFVSGLVEETTVKLFLTKKHIVSLVHKVLIELYGSTNKSPEEVVGWMNFNVVIDKYFVQKSQSNKVYHTALVEYDLDKELSFGIKMSKKFSTPLTTKEIEKEIAISDENRAVFYEDMLEAITRNKCEKF